MIFDVHAVVVMAFNAFPGQTDERFQVYNFNKKKRHEKIIRFLTTLQQVYFFFRLFLIADFHRPMMSNESVAWKMCSSGLDSFTQDVQYEKIAMDWVMEYQPEHYNVLMRRLPGGPWQPGKCRLRWLRLVIEPPFHPEPQAFGCIWLIGEQGKVSGYGGICPSWILLVGLLRVSAARLVSQIEKGWWKEVPLTCYSANMVASQVGAFIRFMKLAHFPSHEGWWSCLISIDIHFFGLLRGLAQPPHPFKWGE